MKSGENGQVLVQDSKSIAFATLLDIALWIDIKLKVKSGENGQIIVQDCKAIAVILLTDILHSIDIK